MSSVVSIIEALETERERIDAAITALRGDSTNGRRSGKRHMSIEARRRIGEATRKRWAKRRKEAKLAAQAA